MVVGVGRGGRAAGCGSLCGGIVSSVSCAALGHGGWLGFGLCFERAGVGRELNGEGAVGERGG